MAGIRIDTIDLDYLGTREAIASYLIEGPGGLVMVETGPGSTTGRLTAELAARDLAPSDIGHVLVTHIHFDHAGAAGWMASHGAQVYVHTFGAKHLIDPSRLLASAKRIYGDEMDRRWGTIEPIPAAQVTPLVDGDVLEPCGLKIRVIETPGHARHHHAYAVDTNDGRVCFTGDVAGTWVCEAPDYASIPTPPPEFELGAWIASIERLEAEHYDAIYPTHFGRVEDVSGHLRRVRASLRRHAALILTYLENDLDRDAMIARYGRWFEAEARAAGIPDEKLGFYITDTMAEMNVDGIVRYWKKQAESRGAEAQGH